MTSPAKHSEFRLGWKVLLASMLGVMCGASPIPFNTIGFFIGPLNAEFGWTFRDISIGITIFGVLASFLAPVFGAMADRFGVRPVALASLVAFGLAFASFAFTPASLTGFYALWVIVGLVGIGSTPVTWSRAVNLWFYRNRGLALGITLIGTSLAAMIVPPLTVWAIGEFGWRMAYPIIALLPLLVALPVGLLFFREPTADERPPELAAADGAALAGMTLREAIRGYRFWVIFLSILLVAFAYGGAHIHLPQMLKAQGFETGQAAIVMSSLGFSILFGRLFTGFLLDRFWAPAVTFPILCLPAVSCLLLSGDSLTLPLAFVAAMFLGFAAGAETDLVAYLAGRYFGMAHYGKIYGMLYMPFGIASAISPAVYGAVRDNTGSYAPILQVALFLFIAGAVLLLLLGRYPDFSKARSRPA
jgi:OFA family oxalate/formate antiporter-like MFS transporter